METSDLLSKIHERIKEKDEVIAVQMDQVAELEDKVNTLEAEVTRLREENASLTNYKNEYETLKKKLDAMLK